MLFTIQLGQVLRGKLLKKFLNGIYSPRCHLSFVKVGFHDRVTCFWVSEDQMPFHKYWRPPILVRRLYLPMSDSWMNDLDTYVYKHSLCTRFYIVQVTMWPWLLFISSKRVCKNLCAKTAICSGDWTVLWEMHLWTSNFLSSSVIIPTCPWKIFFPISFNYFEKIDHEWQKPKFF